MPVTFGIEEEFMLLDPRRLTPVDLGRRVVDDLRGDGAGEVAREFFCSQIEYATPVCETVADAEDALLGFRRRLAQWAADAGVVAAGTGTPIQAARHPAVSSGERYARVATDVGALADDHQINGLHVHVGIPDRDTGVQASNTLRPWLPVLLALSANSPFWDGAETGYDSWRAIHSRRWTTYGVPPRFRDADDYDRTVAKLIGVGATSDEGTINWTVRLSSKYPTLEVRVCDAQLDPSASVALAAIIRALVGTAAMHEPDRTPDSPADAALWHAARFGLGTTLVHPLTGRPAPSREVLRLLHDRTAPLLREDNERAAVDAFLRRAVNGAAFQRRAAASGTPALALLFGESLTTLREGATAG